MLITAISEDTPSNPVVSASFVRNPDGELSNMVAVPLRRNENSHYLQRLPPLPDRPYDYSAYDPVLNPVLNPVPPSPTSTSTIDYETRDDMSLSPPRLLRDGDPVYPPPGNPALGSYLGRTEGVSGVSRNPRYSLLDRFRLPPGSNYPLEGLEPRVEARNDFPLNGEAGASLYPQDPFDVDTMDTEGGNGRASPAGPALRRSRFVRRLHGWNAISLDNILPEGSRRERSSRWPPTRTVIRPPNIRSQASIGYNEYFVLPEA